MPLTPTDYIWMDGKLVPWDDAKVHVLTHTLHYGVGVFEGIRCYDAEDGPAIFRLRDHMERFVNSADLVKMEIPYSVEDLVGAVEKTARKNKLGGGGYVRPVAFFGYGKMGVNPRGAPVNVAIIVAPLGAYLGDEGLEKGIRATISSWRRFHPKTMPTRSKAVGNYVNSVLAKLEALDNGYDEAILLNLDEQVVEGAGENIFIVEGSGLVTPPINSGALEGITRDSVIEIAKDMNLSVEEDIITKNRLLDADEVFFTGTAAEVTPIREIDGKEIGSGGRGQITKKIQSKFFDIVRGKEDKYREWLHYI